MSLYDVVASERGSPGLPWVRNAKTYTLYERDGGLWYVNFIADGRQVRLSTGCRDEESAKALIESYRAPGANHPCIKVNNRHLYKMIERARHRARKKKLAFNLPIEGLRGVIARCNGYCEVTGHPLEDAGPFRPSLDRIDCSRGYEIENVRVVCLIANTAMLHYGEAAFGELAIAFCRKIGLVSVPTRPL